MQPPVSGASRAVRRRVSRVARSSLAAVAVATVIVGTGWLAGSSDASRAGVDDAKGPPPGQPSRQEFIKQIRRSLREYDDRLVVLGHRLLEEPNSPGSLRDQLINLPISVKAAESSYQNARLVREIAELAVKEYTQGVAVQDLATADADLHLARSDMERARDMAELAKAGQARDRERADVELTKRKLALEQAELKRQMLPLAKEARTRELQSEVKKAHADELAKQASWELLKAKQEAIEKALKAPWPASALGKRLLALLDHAWPIEEQIQTGLERLANSGRSDESLQKELRNLANDLAAIIEEAEAARAASDVAGLRSRIRHAIGQ